MPLISVTVNEVCIPVSTEHLAAIRLLCGFIHGCLSVEIHLTAQDG